MSEMKRMMAGIAAMQAEMYALRGKTTSPSREPAAPSGVTDKTLSPTKPTAAESPTPTGVADRQVEFESIDPCEAGKALSQRRNESTILRSLGHVCVIGMLRARSSAIGRLRSILPVNDPPLCVSSVSFTMQI